MSVLYPIVPCSSSDINFVTFCMKLNVKEHWTLNYVSLVCTNLLINKKEFILNLDTVSAWPPYNISLSGLENIIFVDEVIWKILFFCCTFFFNSSIVLFLPLVLYYLDKAITKNIVCLQ